MCVEFKAVVPLRDHRAQLLHIAAVFYVHNNTTPVQRRVWYVIASMERIIHIVRVEFTIAEIESWVACLSVIGKEYVQFGGYNPSFTREEFGRAVDIQTLNQMVRLRNALRVTVAERNQPVPTALYIKPLLVCGWNKWKTGTDSVSRFLKTIAIYGDGQRNPHAWIHKRDLDQVLLNCFKLCQLVKVYDWMMGPEYKGVTRVGSSSDLRNLA